MKASPPFFTEKNQTLKANKVPMGKSLAAKRGGHFFLKNALILKIVLESMLLHSPKLGRQDRELACYLFMHIKPD